MIAGVGLEPNHVWAPCCETWLKVKDEMKIAVDARMIACYGKKNLKLKKCLGRGCPLSWAPCCE